MVVRQHRLPPHRRYLRSNGISIQYMCLSRTLASIHTTRGSRTEWVSNRRSKVVRVVFLYIGRTPENASNGNPSLTRHRLIGINAAQLAIALISNFFLLMNMARRVRFAIAQPITIIGW